MTEPLLEPPDVGDTDIPSDGRMARRYRTRQAIVRAVTELLEEGDLAPTGVRIAERAGVSLRSINHHFEDRDALLVAVARLQVERILATTVVVPRNGPLAPRLDAFVDQRVRVLETLSPVRRASLVYEPFSAALRERTSEATTLGRAEVTRVFAPELEAAGPDPDLVDALDVGASWQTWNTLRTSGLSYEAARRVVRRILASLLADSRPPWVQNDELAP